MVKKSQITAVMNVTRSLCRGVTLSMSIAHNCAGTCRAVFEFVRQIETRLKMACHIKRCVW